MQILRSMLTIVVLVIMGLSFNCIFACTGISLQYNGHYFVGKNHDWISKYADIIINPRGMTNHDPLYVGKDKLLNWAAKYGSITIDLLDNHAVIPAPVAGMNEQGLAVLMLWQQSAKYSDQVTKPVVTTPLLAKYFLDNAATVGEAIQLTKKITVEPSLLPNDILAKLADSVGRDRDIDVHFFLADAKGNAAVELCSKVVYGGKIRPIKRLA